jgi:hypothetical protein
MVPSVITEQVWPPPMVTKAAAALGPAGRCGPPQAASQIDATKAARRGILECEVDISVLPSVEFV